MKYVVKIPLECNQFHYEEFVSLFELTDFIKKIVNREIVFENAYINSLLDEVFLRSMDFYEPQTEVQKKLKSYECDFTVEDYLKDKIRDINYLLDTLHPENHIFRHYVKILQTDFETEQKLIKKNEENTTNS